ncbi:MAG TPA: glucodextranase DOMON-like domain-containing protein [Acidimicrobiia bacterium]|nr:glucodextranase DOMON-like domain-containing protein [Acidimicrobiia bacterium]
MRATAAALVLVLTAACTGGTADTTDGAPTSTAGSSSTVAAEPRIYLNLMWHQHQPLYPKDFDGVVTRPWVRLHAAKDYLDMAALVGEFPELQVTFNLTPTLLLQLEDLAEGTIDSYWQHTAIPAEDLTLGQRRFVVERFFDVNPRIIDRFPRYGELAAMRTMPPEVWEDEDITDLQVLFNLAWTDPSFLEQEQLAALVEKGSGFDEDDKQTVLDEHRRIVEEVIPLHAEMWEDGQIEVTTTPLAHPILPLVADQSLAAVGDPAALLPESGFSEVVDADQQVIRGLDTAERLLGRRPQGMWPGEGSVAQLVMSLFSKNDVQWVATGEDVLAQSVDIGSFTRDADDVVAEADVLYRPWEAMLSRNPPVPMFFRDNLLSDLIGFEYSGTGAEAAADDFMARLEDIADQLEEVGYDNPDLPPVVSVVLDGENAWESYENDGQDFLRALYTRLSEADWVETITPSGYLERFGEPEPLEEVFPASWFQPNFATWIGEEEEATAWEYLAEVRGDLDAAESEGAASQAELEAAYEAMLFAEGSDWFWWYGSDQESGDDEYFDTAFRALLGEVYRSLGQETPDFVAVPIIAEEPIAAEGQPAGLLTATIDGEQEAAWDQAGAYLIDQSVLRWGFDQEALSLLLDLPSTGGFEIYLGGPSGDKVATTFDGVPLGFGATSVILWDGEAASLCPPGGVRHPEVCTGVASAIGEVIEIGVPLDAIGPIESGDVVLAKMVDPGAGPRPLPRQGPMGLQVPDISDVSVVLSVEDPAGDDHGPGSYIYPTDPVFVPGSYDLTNFEIGIEGDDVVVTFDVAAPVQNPWGSPRGLSVQTFDLYIDSDPGEGTGSRTLLPGRNAALPEGYGWEQALTVEGWEPALYLAQSDGSSEETRPSFGVTVFSEEGRVVARLPRQLLPEGDPASWGYTVALLSQEGFPSPGVRRVRDVAVESSQYRIGGGAGGVNDTRILDLVASQQGEQEDGLAVEAVSTGSADDLAVDQLGSVPVIEAD